jgi:2-amino-4-hydroxy-6-hydroxymethyldihydropteridine diphosphokinase
VTDTVYIGLGSNLGDREAYLREATKALGRIDAVAVLRCSSLYDSAPMGQSQPRYMNAVVELECGLPPQRLLVILKQIELDLGRTPGGRWSPRSVDLDILLWERLVVADPNLQIPHLELHKRRFALEPLCELAPEAHHPLLGTRVDELLRSLAPQDVIKVDSGFWPD